MITNCYNDWNGEEDVVVLVLVVVFFKVGGLEAQ